MIWGTTNEQELTKLRTRIAARSHWHPWFAWYPVRLEDGQTAWLETVEVRWLGFWAGAHRWEARRRTKR